MSMPTTDYNQQLLCYLQNWRQLLEQWAAMAAGGPFLSGPPAMPTPPPVTQFMPPALPFMPPALPFMPPMPPIPMAPPTAAAPPAPGDYTQQLFSYLKAWRQYLESAGSAGPASPQAWVAQQPTTAPANNRGETGLPRPGGPTSPSGNATPQTDDHDGSSAKPPPKLVDRAPSRPLQSQLSATNLDPLASPFDGPVERFEMPDPGTLSARPRASRPISDALTRPEGGSAFLSTMNRIGPVEATPVVPRSLFSAPRTSTTAREAGETGAP